MEKNIASPGIRADARSRKLLAYLDSLAPKLGIEDGVVYYDYPLFRDADDVLYRAQVLLASRTHGVFVFSVLTTNDWADPQILLADESLSQLHSIVFGKLLKSRALRRTLTQLSIALEGQIYAPDLADAVSPTGLADRLENTVVTALDSIGKLIERARGDRLSDVAWLELRSILEGAKGLVRPKDRDTSALPSTSKAVLLRTLESEVASFDMDQRRAAISLVDGPQRIRGLAGCGKTIVLAMKAAHIHLSNPSHTILLTFYTRSLYPFIKRLVTRFYRQFHDEDPDWDRVQVLHAWGGRALGGVYYNACVENDVAPIPLREAPRKHEPFASVCDTLLTATAVRPKYDYVLVDEAQDLPTSFMRLCFDLTKGPHTDRNVVWAYDELQTIMNIGVRSPREAFGLTKTGEALVDLDRAAETSGLPDSHDIVLRRSYRNPLEVLVTAHALGFGIYSDGLPVQMLENKEHWQDVGYVVEQGNCVAGEHTVILRPSENSPMSISRQQTAGDLIRSFVAGNTEGEVDWAASEIRALLRDGLRPDDIMIVALDDRNARLYFAMLADRLLPEGIAVNNVLSDPYGQPAFAVDGKITLSTVYRAKGNEAAAVFAMGVDALYPDRDLRFARNKLFTAFTRAKAWLRISGVGPAADYFVREVGKAVAHLPRLDFEYPDTAKITTLQRDLTDKASRRKKLRDELERQRTMLGLDEDDVEGVLSSYRRKK